MHALTRPVLIRERLRGAPYVGVRAYDFDEHELFAGRDADVATVADLIADKDRWRIVLLHGLTGAGKSSFLRAGLIPEITSPAIDTEVYRSTEEASASVFITSTGDPMRRIAEAARGLIERRLDSSSRAEFLASFALSAPAEGHLPTLAADPQYLAAVFVALARHLKRPLLLIVDQAEELYTIDSGPDADQAVERYFDFLAEFCGRSTWIQLLLSMRTEFFGRFDAELRRRLGDAPPVAPYYLRPLSIDRLAHVVTAPCDRVFEDREGRPYVLRYEAGVPERIAADLVTAFPGPGALTCLQIVCVHLVERALAEAAPPTESQPIEAVVRASTYVETVGSVPAVIEDVVDQGLGRFCDGQSLSAVDAMSLGGVVKRQLKNLLLRQAEGAPVTTFIPRQTMQHEIARELVERLPGRRNLQLISRVFGSPAPSGSLIVDPVRWDAIAAEVITSLTESRVVRELTVADEQGAPINYLALGHDVLALGLVEASARQAAKEEEGRREARRIPRHLTIAALAGILAGEAIMILLSLVSSPGESWFDRLLNGLMLGGGLAVLGLYAALVYEFVFHMMRRLRPFREIVLGHHYRQIGLPMPSDPLGVHFFRVIFLVTPPYGDLFRRLTAREREEHAGAGATPFPGRPRF